MRLFFIRHGRQSSALCNVDVDLAEEGIRQARALKERFRGSNQDYDAIYASTLIRAQTTAQLINYKGLDINIRDGIREIDFGELTGHTDEYIKDKYGDFERLRKSALNDIPFPGGECGEDVFKRAKPVINEIISKDYQNVIIVTHGGAIRSIVAGLLGLEFSKKLLFGRGLENCSITRIDYDRQMDMFTLESFNDYAHLEQYPELLRGAWKK